MRAVCLILFLSAACRETSSDARSVRLFFTSEFRGQVRAEDGEGGLARLVSVLKRADGPHWLDVGDLLPSPADPTVSRLLTHQLGAHALALNLGPHEIQQASLLHTLRREGAVPWLSANARPIEEWSLARSFVRSVDGVRLGITGVVLPEAVESRDFVLLEHGPALANEVHALREAGAEVLVLLARLEQDQARVLAEVAPELDFIIYGAERPHTAEPHRHGRTWLLHGGGRGRTVGVLRLSVQASEAPFRAGGEGDGHANRFWLDLVSLDGAVPMDPEVSARVSSMSGGRAP